MKLILSLDDSRYRCRECDFSLCEECNGKFKIKNDKEGSDNNDLFGSDNDNEKSDSESGTDYVAMAIIDNEDDLRTD